MLKRIINLYEEKKLQQKTEMELGIVSEFKTKLNFELELKINISEKKEILSLKSDSFEFSSTINTLNKELHLNKTENLGTIIISLLNDLPKAQDISQQFKDKMNESTLYSLEQSKEYLYNFYNSLLNINSYFILFLNEFFSYYDTNADIDFESLDDEKFIEEFIKNRNKSKNGNKLYFDFYLQNFINFTKQIINGLLYLLKLVVFEHNIGNRASDTLPDKYIKKTGLENNMFETIDELENFETPNLKISYEKKEDDKNHIKLNTKYNIHYTYKIINIGDFVFAYLPLYYSKILKIKICQDINCIKFYNSRSKYCSIKCRNKNYNYSKEKVEQSQISEITHEYDSTIKMFNYKITKCRKYTKKQKHLLETKCELFCERYKKYLKKFKKNPSQAKYEKLINFIKLTHKSLQSANTTEEIRSIKTTCQNKVLPVTKI